MRSTASTGYPDLVARLEGEKIVVELKAISGTGGLSKKSLLSRFPNFGCLKVRRFHRDDLHVEGQCAVRPLDANSGVFDELQSMVLNSAWATRIRDIANSFLASLDRNSYRVPAG